jgi:hypothetical protein
MKTKILDINGKKTKDIELPKYFSGAIREDVVAKVLEARKTQQPYSPSPVAGKQFERKIETPKTRLEIFLWKGNVSYSEKDNVSQRYPVQLGWRDNSRNCRR